MSTLTYTLFPYTTLFRSAQFEQYVKLNMKIPREILTSLTGIDDAGRLADTISAHLPLKLEQKQQMLEVTGTSQRLENLLSQLESEIDILQVEKRIRGRVKKQMEKSQRSEEHTSELQSLMRISYAVFCLKKTQEHKS